MARRFVRDLFTGKVDERNDDPATAFAETNAKLAHNAQYDPRRTGKHGGAYSQGWNMEALAVPIEQISTFNEQAARCAPGVTYVPTRDGGYAVPIGESRRSRNALLKMSGKIDFDGGYSDHTGS